MAVSTFPIWVILSIVCFLFLIILSKANYYLPRISKIKAKCVVNKSKKQRNNTILRMRRRINEGNYPWIVFIMYAVITICFLAENHKALLAGELLLLRVVFGFLIWLVSAIIVVCFAVAFMKVLQDNAVKDLKNYYFSHYGVTVIYLNEENEKEYHEYESSN